MSLEIVNFDRDTFRRVLMMYCHYYYYRNIHIYICTGKLSINNVRYRFKHHYEGTKTFDELKRKDEYGMFNGMLGDLSYEINTYYTLRENRYD